MINHGDFPISMQLWIASGTNFHALRLTSFNDVECTSGFVFRPGAEVTGPISGPNPGRSSLWPRPAPSSQPWAPSLAYGATSFEKPWKPVEAKAWERSKHLQKQDIGQTMLELRCLAENWRETRHMTRHQGETGCTDVYCTTMIYYVYNTIGKGKIWPQSFNMRL